MTLGKKAELPVLLVEWTRIAESIWPVGWEASNGMEVRANSILYKVSVLKLLGGDGRAVVIEAQVGPDYWSSRYLNVSVDEPTIRQILTEIQEQVWWYHQTVKSEVVQPIATDISRASTLLPGWTADALAKEDAYTSAQLVRIMVRWRYEHWLLSITRDKSARQVVYKAQIAYGGGPALRSASREPTSTDNLADMYYHMVRELVCVLPPVTRTETVVEEVQ